MDLKVPNVERAVVAYEKLIGYLLNERHPQGGGKARFFRPLGYDENGVDRFADDLRQHALQNRVVSTRETPYGVHYVVDGPIDTPSGRTVQIVSVWLVEAGIEVPRLVTAYPNTLVGADS